MRSPGPGRRTPALGQRKQLTATGKVDSISRFVWSYHIGFISYAVVPLHSAPLRFNSLWASSPPDRARRPLPPLFVMIILLVALHCSLSLISVSRIARTAIPMYAPQS
jgi:hypothetical protein